jgi:UDP-N-acetyl-D-glucosamine dehydrogenase
MSKHLNALKRRVDRREARVGVVGLGYVGLPLAVEFADAGFRTVGIDVDPAKVKTVRAGRSHIEDVATEDVRRLVRKKLLTARADYDVCGELDAIFIAVPTPLRKTRDPDISYIVSAVGQIAPHLRPGQLIVLESTTYPGTTDEIVRPAVEESGLTVGKDLFLAFSPERVDPANPTFHTRNTPKVVGGTTPSCARAARLFYSQAIDEVHLVSSTQAAEMIKLLENTFRAVNIGLVNEIALMCEKLDLDVWEVIDGAATKPFGFMKFYPGPGIGGHCIPLDPHYLAWKLRTLDYSARFIELASEINGDMPRVVVRRAAEMLNDRSKALRGSKIAILGVAYKRDTTDVRESPALDVIGLLSEAGAKVSFHDPLVAELRLEDGAALRSRKLTSSYLAGADLAIVITDHSCFDWARIVGHTQMLLDTRNATRDVRSGRRKVRKL